jgi:arsenical pump membrane protein
VLVFAARRRRVAVEPFLFGCVFMANASSLFLPGSNLTNLLVLDAHGGGSGASFAAKMFPLAITAAVVTAIGIALSFRRALAARPSGSVGDVDRPQVVLGAGVLATAAAIVFVLVLRNPALEVLGVGLAAVAVELLRSELSLADVWRVVGPPSLAAAFVLTVALGTLARHWDGPAELIAHASGPETAGIAALSTVLVNNLPSAALYSAHSVDHSRMLLLGLNVGPNLAVTGALSALLWFRAAREVDARPSLLEFSRRGVPLAVIAMAAAIVAGMLT